MSINHLQYAINPLKLLHCPAAGNIHRSAAIGAGVGATQYRQPQKYYQAQPTLADNEVPS